MKKIILVFLILFIVSCKSENKTSENIEKEITQEVIITNETHYYYEENSTIIGIFDIEKYETEDGINYPYCLRIEKPITVVSKKVEDDFNVPETDVEVIQLALSEIQIKYLKDQKAYGKKVKIVGEMFSAHTIHHFTAVVMTVEGIEIIE